MHEAHTEFLQLLLQDPGCLLRGLCLQHFGFLDQGADPVSLATFPAGLANSLDNFIATAVGDDDGLDRCASRWQLVDHGEIEVGIGGHGERARDRCRRHDELVGKNLPGSPFLAKSETLVHAETMLLVDDDETESVEIDALLKERMRSDNQPCRSVRDLLETLCTRLALVAACKPQHRYIEWLEPVTKVLQMLFG